MARKTTRSSTQRKRKQEEKPEEEEDEEVELEEKLEQPSFEDEAPITTVAIHTAKRSSKNMPKRSKKEDELKKQLESKKDSPSYSATDSLGSKEGRDEEIPKDKVFEDDDTSSASGNPGGNNDGEDQQSNSQANSKTNESEAEDSVEERKASIADEDAETEDQSVNSSTPEAKGPNTRGSAKKKDDNSNTADIDSEEVEEANGTAAKTSRVEEKSNQKENLEPNEMEGSSALMIAAYLLYCVENKSRVTQDFPAKEFNGIAKVLTEEFRALPGPEITRWCNAALERETDLESWMDPFDRHERQQSSETNDGHIKNVEIPKNKVVGAGKSSQNGGKTKTKAPEADKSSKGEHKKKRAKKDPNAPKRFGGPYIMYSNSVRDEVKAKNPDLSFTEIGTVIGSMYRSLSAENRQYWKDKAEEDKSRYSREMAVFNQRKEEEATYVSV